MSKKKFLDKLDINRFDIDSILDYVKNSMGSDKKKNKASSDDKKTKKKKK